MFSISEKTPRPPRVPEFQAIVLCGYGSRLYPLAADEGVTKALLPVANKPMLYYQLNWLENAGVYDIIIVTHPEAKQHVRDYMEKMYEGAPETKAEVVALQNYDGTADALRYIKDKIKRDFIVLSSDLITDIPAHRVLDAFRLTHPAMSVLFYESLKPDAGSSLEKVVKEDAVEYVGISPLDARLVLAPRAEIRSELPIQTSLIRKFPVFHLHTGLRDAHLYVCKHWVLDLLVLNPKIASLRAEMLPLLVKCQYSEKAARAAQVDKAIFPHHRLPTTSQTRVTPTPTPTISISNHVRVTALVTRDGYTARANTISSYSEMNRQMTKVVGDARIAATAEISQRTTVGPDSMVGDGTKVGEKSIFKKSIVGAHCGIGKNCKITNSVIMDYVVLDDNVSLTNCVICLNAKIGMNTVLKDCEVGARFEMAANTQAKNDQFTHLHQQVDFEPRNKMNGVAGHSGTSTGVRTGLGDVTVNNIKQLKVICENSEHWSSLQEELKVDDKFWKDVIESGELAKLLYYNDIPVAAIISRREAELPSSAPSSPKTKLRILLLNTLPVYRNLDLETMLVEHIHQQTTPSTKQFYIELEASDESTIALFNKLGYVNATGEGVKASKTCLEKRI
ncbi:hypothetical protein SmJEL517_g01952 [Synchytrium microbalum]|uniref:Translation initiation factor eIF2B subunit gamma n=1 Tax=Synchytrium microbalum TaxID=1806994 RepID=A0A507C2K4_9FUNG|nr:uncharacterized protein SmJEL517_g01952 [Synchytrium microbalum]TPX35740.1 hypothetical protein SmJEL517_g01952 [Synchytrium microbalum]